jgi:hypothetical protein
MNSTYRKVESMPAEANLFFDGTSVGSEEAPPRIIRSELFSMSYYAVLKKRFDRITADDFLLYARRLTALCDTVYGASRIEMSQNSGVPLGAADLNAASQGVYEHLMPPGQKIGISQLTVDSFRQLFIGSDTMILSVYPIVARDDTQSSFAQIEWSRGRPRTIFFYAQGGGGITGNRFPGDSHPALQDLLTRKMFHIPGAAPNFHFAVKLGIDADTREREGRRFGRWGRSF